MANVKTLSDVIEYMRNEGQLVRNTGTNSLKTIKGVLTDTITPILAGMHAEAREQRLKGVQETDTDLSIRNILIDTITPILTSINDTIMSIKDTMSDQLAELRKAHEEARIRHLQDIDAERERIIPAGDGAESINDDIDNNPNTNIGGIGGLGIAALPLGIVSRTINGVKDFFGKVFSIGAIGRVLSRVATKIGPVAIITSIIAAISGGIDGFLTSERETIAGKIADGLMGAIGQLIEWVSFGLIDKEAITEKGKPITDTIEALFLKIGEMIMNPLKTLSSLFDSIWKDLGLDDLSQTLSAETKMSGADAREAVGKFFKNLFAFEPDEGSLSIIAPINNFFNDIVDEFAKMNKYIGESRKRFATKIENFFSFEPKPDTDFSLVKSISDWLSSILPTKESFKLSLPDMPALNASMFPSMENVKSLIGTTINHAFQSLAASLDGLSLFGKELIPEPIIRGISNIGESVAQSMGVKDIERYNTETKSIIQQLKEDNRVGENQKFHQQAAVLTQGNRETTQAANITSPQINNTVVAPSNSQTVVNQSTSISGTKPAARTEYPAAGAITSRGARRRR